MMEKSYWVVLVIVSLLLVGCGGEEQEPEVVKEVKELVEKEDVALVTEDNLQLIGTMYRSSLENAPGMILLHMLNSERSVYNGLAAGLQSKGYNVLSIDFRGHGQSINNNGETWNDFSPEDFESMVLDVKAAKVFMGEEGIRQVGIIGASIGANVALNYAVTDNGVRTLILLSPGRDYRGVETDTTAELLQVPVMLVAAELDEYAYDSIRWLETDITSKKLVQRYKGSNLHGTNLFGQTNIEELIFNWLDEELPVE
jgi:pimeloyl-ACP methyl ester carboxylesterase